MEGKIGVDTSLPPEMLDYANADIEGQVRQGVDKDLQPAMTKSLGKIQKDVQEKEAERDATNQQALSDGQKKVEKEKKTLEKNKTKPSKNRKRVLIRNNAKPNLVFKVKSTHSRKRMTVRLLRLKKKASNV